MIIKELSKHIILDDIRINANPAEVYFLSHLLGNEMLCLPEDWPARIYTSEFMFDVLVKKKPKVSKKFFKILQPNVPIKMKSKDKTIMVTMFETGEITQNVMFYFDDSQATYLYTGVFTEIGGLYGNEHFILNVEKGIDFVCIDTTRCQGKSYIFTEATITEVKQIASSHPDFNLAVIMPSFGYEKLLVHLAKEFPQNVYPTVNQRRILSKLGHEDLASKTNNSRIVIYPPGLTSEFIESLKRIPVYITEGKSSEIAGICEIYVRQWSPLPSLMDLQALLDMIKPRNIIPIRHSSLEGNTVLPSSLQWIIAKEKEIDDEFESSEFEVDSIESSLDMDSARSIDSSCSSLIVGPNEIESSQATTQLFVRPNNGNSPSKTVEKEENLQEENQQEATNLHKANTQENYDLIAKRRIIRRRVDLNFEDSD